MAIPMHFIGMAMLLLWLRFRRAVSQSFQHGGEGDAGGYCALDEEKA